MPVFKGGKLWVPPSERQQQEEREREKQRVTCDYPQQFTATDCPECNSRIIVHCPHCNQKVTGCGCTMKTRVEGVKEELIERLFD